MLRRARNDELLLRPIEPEILAEAGVQLLQQFLLDLLDARGRDQLGLVDFGPGQAGLVLIEILALEPRLLVIGPDEGLTAGSVIMLVGVRNRIAQGLEDEP